MTYYMVYRRKDDCLVACGSARQCAKMLGYASVNQFYGIVSKTRNGTVKKWEIAKVEVD